MTPEDKNGFVPSDVSLEEAGLTASCIEEDLPAVFRESSLCVAPVSDGSLLPSDTPDIPPIDASPRGELPPNAFEAPKRASPCTFKADPM
jgi:hypothetical protein